LTKHLQDFCAYLSKFIAMMRLLEELPQPAQNVSVPTQLLVDDGSWNGMPD
jgi:hypothetical protein